MPADQRWTIKPELLVSPLNGAEISVGIAYGPAVDKPIVVASVDELEQDFRDVEEHAFELFNPPDDDSTTVWSVIDRAHAFIVAQPCTCKKDLVKRIYVPARELQAGDVEHNYGCIENDEYDWADLDIEAVEVTVDRVEVTYRQTKLWGTTIQRPFVFRDPARRVLVRRGPVEYEYDGTCARCQVLGRLADEAVSR